MAIIAVSPAIGPVRLDVIVKERHTHELGITSDPIETGAEVNDHAYKKPKRIELEFGAGQASETFNALVQLQESRQPFNVVSGLYIYTNMLIETLNADRDMLYSRVCSGRAALQEIIIVSTAYASSDDAETGEAGQPGGKDSTRAAKPDGSIAGDNTTADRVSGTVNRGDQPVTTVPDGPSGSILKQVFG